MKTVMPSKDVARVWAARAQPTARNGTGSLYFRGLTIYSYGEHFPIARWLSETSDVCLFATRRYSSTTAKHMTTVSRALPSNCQTIHVSDPSEDLSEATLDEVQELIDVLIEQVKRARQNKQWRIQCLTQRVARFNTIADLIGSPRKANIPKPFIVQLRLMGEIDHAPL